VVFLLDMVVLRLSFMSFLKDLKFFLMSTSLVRVIVLILMCLKELIEFIYGLDILLQ